MEFASYLHSRVLSKLNWTSYQIHRHLYRQLKMVGQLSCKHFLAWITLLLIVEEQPGFSVLGGLYSSGWVFHILMMEDNTTLLFILFSCLCCGGTVFWIFVSWINGFFMLLFVEIAAYIPSRIPNFRWASIFLKNFKFRILNIPWLITVLWRRGVIQLTRGVKSSVWSGFEPSHGSVTARVEVSISLPTTEILATGAKTPFHLHLHHCIFVQLKVSKF